MNKIVKNILLFLGILISINVSGTHKVYIIHGWGNYKEIMREIHRDVRKEGYATENYPYPAFMVDLDSLGAQLYKDVKNDAFDTVSFVTHSMGGLVFRNMLKYSGQDPEFPIIRRVVMISPPNQGADIANHFESNDNLHLILGPNVRKMQTDSNSYANQLPVPINCEIGIIIGARGKEIGYNPLIEGDNDGLIKPEHTLLGNETDKITLKLDHLAVIKSRKSRKQVIYFLENGKFKHKE